MKKVNFGSKYKFKANANPGPGDYDKEKAFEATKPKSRGAVIRQPKLYAVY